MSKSGLSLLQKAACSTVSSTSSEESIAKLNEAFQLFSQETVRLEKAYHDLEKRFASVNLELEESNQKLNQKLAELDSVTNYLDNILGQMNQGILFVGLSGLMTTCNAAAEGILEKESKELLLLSFWDHFEDRYFGFSMKEDLKRISASSSRGGESCIVNHDLRIIKKSLPSGEEKEIEVTTSSVSQGPDSNRGIIVLLRDTTKVRRLQRIANQGDRLKDLGEMAACLAHEIRNPLGGIEGFASLLERDLQDNLQMREMAKHIVSGTRTLNSLVSKVLNYSRPVHLCCELVDMTQFFSSVVQLLKADRGFPKNVSIRVDVSEETISLMVDPVMFKSAAINLILNAAQAMPEGGEVSISVWVEAKTVFICFSDEGEGILPEHVEKVFTPFFTTKKDGNGFGLSEVYKVIRAHDGTIEVDSEIGKGTSFLIKLPVIVD